MGGREVGAAIGGWSVEREFEDRVCVGGGFGNDARDLGGRFYVTNFTSRFL